MWLCVPILINFLPVKTDGLSVATQYITLEIYLLLSVLLLNLTKVGGVWVDALYFESKITSVLVVAMATGNSVALVSSEANSPRYRTHRF